MNTFWKKWTAVVPAPFLTALLLGAGFMMFVAWDQSYWWRIKDDYGFGWLVPAFVAFVVYDRWPRILAALKACAEPGSPRASEGAATALTLYIRASMAGGGLLFLMGAFYRAGASSYPGTLALSLGLGAVLMPLLLISSPEPAGATVKVGFSNDARVKLVSLFVFPALVWLVSAPMISIIETNLSVFMLNRVTAVVFFFFDMLGMQIVQQGNVLTLKEITPGVTNQVGVADACSGIRSFTACVFAGSFLASVFLDKLWKKVALVSAAVCFAFAMNLMRGLFLTAWAYNYGSEKMEGRVHDVAGYAVLGLTVIGLMCMLPLFSIEFISAHDREKMDEVREIKREL